MRVACLFIPSFPLAARLRAHPTLKEQPLAILDGQGAAARIVAATLPALRAGVPLGVSLPEARAIFPLLASESRDAEAERSAHAALIEVADASSPRVEPAEPGVVYLDLYGEKEESFLAENVRRRALRLGLPVQIGIAGSKSVARVAAESEDSPTLVPLGGEAAFLARLPLHRIHPSPALADLLHKWGVRSVGELAHLPELQILRRLGKEGWDLQQAAQGVDERPLVPRRPPEHYQEGLELEWPILELEPFLTVAGPLIGRLTARLENVGMACRRLELLLKLDPLGHDPRALDLPAPTREAATLLRLIRSDMEQRPPAAPVVGLTFTAVPEAPRRAQLDLFEPAALSPDSLAATLARLAALLGPGRAGAPQRVAGHRPERFSLVPFGTAPFGTGSEGDTFHFGTGSQGDTFAGPRTFVRVLRPALPLAVSTMKGQPVTLRSQGPKESLLVEGRVRVASGPWTLEEGWWSDLAVQRAYWDIELMNSSLFRVYQDLQIGDWWVDGVYD